MAISNHPIALGVATTTLFIRTVFRSVELSEGFSGKLANSEVQFMVLDGVMVIIACICMTVFHPGIGFGHKWKEAKFPFGKAQGQVEHESGKVVSGEKAGPVVNEHEQAPTELRERI